MSTSLLFTKGALLALVYCAVFLVIIAYVGVLVDSLMTGGYL